MTTLEASLKLFNWFSEKDYFNYPKDLNKLLVIHEICRPATHCPTCR